MKLITVCMVLIGLTSTTTASCAIYAQRDAASGAMVYSNVPALGRNSSVVPPVARARIAPPHGASFPIIARAEQQQRDLDRHAILRIELDDEQERLDRARAAGAAADVQQRHLSNIAALKREIATVR